MYLNERFMVWAVRTVRIIYSDFIRTDFTDKSDPNSKTTKSDLIRFWFGIELTPNQVQNLNYII